MGPNRFTIAPEHISLPPGVILKRVEPPVVEVTVDIPMEKVLPVQVDRVGRLPEDVRIVEAIFEPETIHVAGGKGILENMATAYTEKVPVDSIKTSGEMTIGLALKVPSLRIAPGSTDRVNIKYVVKEREKSPRR